MMRGIPVIIGCLILCGTANTLYAEEKFLRFDGSFQLSGMRMPNLGEGSLGVGGRFGYRLSSFLFLDAGGLHFPGGGESHAYKKTLVLGGIRVGKQFNEHGFFVRLRSGTASFQGRGGSRLLGGKTYPVMDIGTTLEMYRSKQTKENPLIRGKNMFVRIDISNCIIFIDDMITDGIDRGEKRGANHNLLFEFGVGFRF